MFKRCYDENESFTIDESTVLADLANFYNTPTERIQDIKDGFVIRTPYAAYAATAEQLTDAALTVRKYDLQHPL